MAITIERACKVLQDDYFHIYEGNAEELEEAQQLAIAALRRIARVRELTGVLTSPLSNEKQS